MVKDYTPDEEKRMAQSNARYSILEAQRVEAMNNRDAKKYADLCDRLGVEPELPELIERAKADEVYASRNEEQPVLGLRKNRVDEEQPVLRLRKNRANPVKYQSFLDDARGCNYSDFASDADSKRKILKRHFGGRYQAQHMDSYEDVKLGAVFKKIVDSAEDIVNRE